MHNGHLRWLIPDGYLPPISSGDLISHEAVCVLNTGQEDAMIAITVYFENRDPIEFKDMICKAKRTNHIRMDLLQDGKFGTIPKGVPYALELVSSVPVFIQFSRLDSTQPALALFTTMAFPV